MSLFAIGDTHLSFAADKPMDAFGGQWVNYTQKLIKGFGVLRDGDVCVLCGDISWGMSLEESLDDFLFIDRLPGKKIILKGNHDYWWTTAKKTHEFFEKNHITTIDILNNNCFFYGETAICGTRGWFFDEAAGIVHDKKIMDREVMRLEASLKAAGDAAEKLCFFHYPPRFKDYVCDGIIEIMAKYGVRDCWYGHLHGLGHRYAVTGAVEGINYHLISSDYVNFTPQKII